MARKKTKMRTGKVKRVKKTRNSRRTKRNTRRRNKRGGDTIENVKGSLKFIKELGKGVSGAVGRSLKDRYDKYLKRKNKGQTDKGIKQPLLVDYEKTEKEANGPVTLEEKAREKAKAVVQDKIRVDKANMNYLGSLEFSDYDNALRHNKNHYKDLEEKAYKNELSRLKNL